MILGTRIFNYFIIFILYQVVSPKLDGRYNGRIRGRGACIAFKLLKISGCPVTTGGDFK